MKTTNVFKSQKGKEDILKYYDFMVNQCSFSYERININTRYGNTHIIASGDKNNLPIILLHGSGMNSVMWIKDMEKYSKNYRVYAVDILGEPGRSAENQLPLKGDFYALWLKDVFNSLSIEKASIIGISLGAWLSVKFAVSYRENLDKLVLISPSGIGPQKTSFLIKALFYKIFGEKGMDRLCYKVNGNNQIPEVMLKYQKLIEKNFNYRREIIPIFSDEELKKLTMPIELFVGEKDIMLHSLKTAKRLENLLPHANINILLGAGHSIANLADKISTFLQLEKD